MNIVFGQTAQECGSEAVSIYQREKELARVGIGEEVELTLPDGACDVVVRCGTLLVPAHLEEPCHLEVAWDLRNKSMVLRKDKREIGTKNMMRTAPEFRGGFLVHYSNTFVFFI